MRRYGKNARIYAKAAVLLLCLLFVLLPDVRFAASENDASGANVDSSYHQQHQYAPPAASHQTPVPDMAALPLGLGFGTMCAAAALQSLHADSRIPILRKHRLLRPLKFRGSFLSFFRIPT
ncbi:hypothetical protein CDO73_15305 [Saccharibacillus sp. O23]|uniref:hypothetical protein n=1 Tax=Saccharibacillus sp. O23 TaxID=2009338 RepID=UPI000B4E3F2B|nr:hypothetical protein [Saccharibacillus sp. O23]OWR29551.1 hypothetical protein CDO73_15305 [Saccharibacillus sp. O23]